MYNFVMVSCMKKFFLYITFFSFLFLFNATKVDAFLHDECIDKEECMVLCNYVNNIAYYGKRELTMYYYFDNTFQLNWEAMDQADYSNGGNHIFSKGPDNFSKIFSNSGTNVYYPVSNYNTESTFRCPTNGFLDSGFLPDNELCFDNDGKSCAENHNNVGTKFSNSNQSKNYDFETQIEAYSKTLFNAIKDDVSSGNFDLEKDLNNRIVQDLKNIFFDNDIPTFIKNNPSYKNLKNNILKEFKTIKEEETKKIDEAYAAGKITEEEKNEQTDNWNTDNQTITDIVNYAQKSLLMGDGIENNFNQPQDCDTIFGDVEEPNEPAYWIQLTLNIMRYVAIAALILLSSLDFIKAIASQDNEAVQKAIKTSVQRLMFTVILFFLPMLIEALFKIFGFYDVETCKDIIK